jgi:hypothetical protein
MRIAEAAKIAGVTPEQFVATHANAEGDYHLAPASTGSKEGVPQYSARVGNHITKVAYLRGPKPVESDMSPTSPKDFRPERNDAVLALHPTENGYRPATVISQRGPLSAVKFEDGTTTSVRTNTLRPPSQGVTELHSGFDPRPVLRQLGILPSGAGTGRFRAVGDISPTLEAKVYAANSARESGATNARVYANHILEDLTHPADLDLFERLVLHENAQRLAQPHNVPELAAIEQADMSDWLNGVMAPGPSFDRWSRVMDAAARYRATAKPDILHKTLRTAPGLSVSTTPNDLYMRLFPQTDSHGNAIPSNQMGRPKGATGPAANRSKVKRAVNVGRAYGSGHNYRQDFARNLEQSYSDVQFRAALADILTTAHAEGYAVPDNFKGTTPKFNGTDQTFTLPDGSTVPAVLHVERTVRYPIIDPFNGKTLGHGGNDKRVWLPQPLEQALQELTARTIQPTGLAKGWQGVQRLTTSIQMASPGHLLWHAYRVLSVGSRMAAPAMQGKPLTWLPSLGPKAQLLYEIAHTDFSDPVVYQRLQRVMESGGGSFRPFGDMVGNRFSQWGHERLFGFPEGKGVATGFDLRARVVLEALREKIEGNTDPKRTRDYLNQLGQYSKNPDYLIAALRNVNPYAATQLPMKATEYRQLLGDSGMKAGSPATKTALRLSGLWHGVVGFIVAKELLNYLFSGHLSYRNAPGHEFDIDLGGGRYMSIRALDPGVARATKDTGLQSLAQGKKQQAGVDVTNNLMTTVGNEPINLLFAGATGTALHANVDHEGNLSLMNIAPKGATPTQKALAAALTVNPLAAGAGDLSGATGNHSWAKEPPGWKVAGALQMMFGKVITHPQASGGMKGMHGMSGMHGMRGMR